MHSRDLWKGIQGIIFDCDGVVVDSEPLIFKATHQVFSRLGADIKQEDILGGIGAGKRYVSDPMKKYGITTPSLEELLEDRRTEYRKLAKRSLKPQTGIEDLLSVCKKAGFRIALASSARTSTVLFNLECAKLPSSLFDAIVDGDRFQNKKPAPDIFLAAASEIKLTPEKCLVVEDAKVGVTASKRAGMRTIGLCGSFSSKDLGEADWAVKELGEITASLTHLLEETDFDPNGHLR
jgi:HAD superfamily hydrolase (TIGR01509 family)